VASVLLGVSDDPINWGVRAMKRTSLVRCGLLSK
jgi:hypothetical protein